MGPAPGPELPSCTLQRSESLAGNRCKPHAISDRQQAHGIPVRPKHRKGGAAEQPPAAGRGKRVHTGLATRDAYAAGWYPSTRRRQTRRRQRFGQFTEIRETGHKPQKIHKIGSRSMQLDCLRWRHPVHCTHIVQVWTVLAAVAHGNFQLPRLREMHVFQPVEIGPQNRLQFDVAQLQRIEFDQQRGIRRMKIADARNGFQLEQAEQPHHMLMSIECNLLPEVNQQRLVARGLEPRGVGCRGKHDGEIIPHAAFAFIFSRGQASGKFASAFNAEPASSPASSFGYAAAAIMAALSVERARLGKKTSRPRFRASSSNERRSWLLAATPPETRMERAPDSSAAASVRVTKSLTTAA